MVLHQMALADNTRGKCRILRYSLADAEKGCFDFGFSQDFQQCRRRPWVWPVIERQRHFFSLLSSSANIWTKKPQLRDFHAQPNQCRKPKCYQTEQRRTP